MTTPYLEYEGSDFLTLLAIRFDYNNTIGPTASKYRVMARAGTGVLSKVNIELCSFKEDT